jgi:hypothetical protein
VGAKLLWQYHKNPEAGSTDHQDRADFKDQAVVDLTKEVLGADLFPEEKLNIVSIILSGYRRYDLSVKMWK